MDDYAFRIDTALSASEVRSLLEPFRPFRIEVCFSNGFSTSDFRDVTAYPSKDPLAKLHFLRDRLQIGPATSVLDVGSHIGHYGHHFLRAGAASFTGVEYDRRTHETALALAKIAGLKRARFLNMDFGAPELGPTIRDLGCFDTVICLAVINAVGNWQLALQRMAEATAGTLVLEYAALETDQPVCEYSGPGHGADRAHKWWFSESFIDGVLAEHGLKKLETTLRWRNDAVLGAGHLKIMSLYNRSSLAAQP